MQYSKRQHDYQHDYQKTSNLQPLKTFTNKTCTNLFITKSSFHTIITPLKPTNLAANSARAKPKERGLMQNDDADTGRCAYTTF